MRLLFALTALFCGFEARADWRSLVDRVAASEMHALTRHTDPDPTANRVVDSISVVGETLPDGTFHRDHLEIATENWVIEPDDVKNAERWAWTLSLEGSITSVTHLRLTEELDGTPLDEQRLAPTALDDPDMLERVAAKIQEWDHAQ